MNGWPTGYNNPSHNMTAEQNYKKGNAFRGKRRLEHGIKISGKNNGRYSHGNRTKEKSELLRLESIEKHRIANRKFIQVSKQCIHCYLKGKGPNMIRYHFDNCKLNPDNPLNILGKFSTITKIDNRGKLYTCQFCGFIGKNLGNMNRWHFNNCKQKIGNKMTNNVIGATKNVDNKRSLKVAIDLVGGKLTNNKKSHKNGWAHMRARQLSKSLDTEVTVLHDKESWDDYDLIYLYHGMEFKGSLNLFGGAKEEGAKFFERLVNPKCKLISLDIPMPDYGELCKGRLKSCDDYWRNVDWNAVTETCKSVVSFYTNTNTNSLTIGDSHSFSVWKPGNMILRKDSRTLRGVLRKTLRKEIEDAGMNPEFSHLTLYYGNIDVRHHLMREDDPAKALASLLIEYVKQIKELNPETVELVCLLPVEDESRRLPKTGQYEGTNFYGTQKERSNLVRVFNNGLRTICQFNNWDLYEWPPEWYEISPIDYMKTYMESPKSVHIAPLYHRTNYWPENELLENSKIENLINY